MKVLASDFDGTLFFDGKFKTEDIQKIKEFQKQGNLFGLCSGRPFKGIIATTDGQIDYDFYILCTGALVLNKQQEVIYKNTITPELLKRFYEKYMIDYKIFIQANFQIYAFEDDVLTGIVRQKITSLEEVEGDIYGISMNTGDENNAKKICQEIIDTFSELDAFQNKEFIDVVPKGSSKGNGISHLKTALGIQSIAGIGDSYNDITMLDEVNQAFTFSNSPDVVKEHADYIVSSVAEAIDQLIIK